MDKNKQAIIDKQIEKTMKALTKNNMLAYFVQKKEEAVELVDKLLNSGDVVAAGGSMTLVESGIIDHLKSGKYNFIEKNPQDNMDINISAFSADVYLSSSNAITENGELYNVDGNSNRVAAILYGPKSVIIVAGYNKLVKNLEEAVNRVKNIAAPINCIRLDRKTYCAKNGECVSCASERTQSEYNMTSGCDSEDRICRNYVINAKQRNLNRIKVILVNEELGY